MKYLMMVCVEVGKELPPELEGRVNSEVEAWISETDGRGVRLQGQVLADAQDATTVRVRAGELVISDGPFAETKEQIGGFDILDCADLDEAIEVASKHPVARFGSLELRPFADS